MQARTILRPTLLAAVIVGAAFSRTAHAHFNLVMPPPADNATDGGKGAPPCGPTTPSNVVTPAQGGHALMVSLSETVLHPGHYRIALSINSRNELPADPVAVVANGASVSAPFEDPPVFPVLADDVFDHTSGTTPISFQTTVMLPNVTCTKCTLQVIEFMAQHGPNPGGGYYYHHCADLAITADPSMPIFDPNAPAGGTGGAAGGAGGAAGGTTTTSSDGCTLAGRGARLSGLAASALVGLGLALASRRRRRR